MHFDKSIYQDKGTGRTDIITHLSCNCGESDTHSSYCQCLVSIRALTTYFTALTLFDTGAYTSFPNREGTCLSVFRADPCPFPRYKTYSIEDYSLATDNCYPSQEGARMVGLTREALLKTTHTKVPKRKANVTDEASSSSSGIKRQMTLKQSATGQLGLQSPFDDAKVSD